MKPVSRLALMCAVLFFISTLQAQVKTSSRPCLFNNVASVLPATYAQLDKIFLASEGSSIQLQFNNGFTFNGVVSSSVKKYDNLSSVIIKSPELHNALMAVSKRINDDRTITYVGRIINESYADGYELKKDDKGNYAFNKIKTEDLIQDY